MTDTNQNTTNPPAPLPYETTALGQFDRKLLANKHAKRILAVLAIAIAVVLSAQAVRKATAAKESAGAREMIQSQLERDATTR